MWKKKDAAIDKKEGIMENNCDYEIEMQNLITPTLVYLILTVCIADAQPMVTEAL